MIHRRTHVDCNQDTFIIQWQVNHRHGQFIFGIIMCIYVEIMFSMMFVNFVM